MASKKPLRIAMWSGPRNISTAMMRSWGNRSDTYVCDEPLYAHYLAQTGAPHPGADEVIRHHESDWRKVARELTGPVPQGKTVYYQKHMSHHLLPEIERDWLDDMIHCFLIREPAEMLTSLVHHLPRPELRDTGLEQQVEIFERVRDATGAAPPVIDSRDVLLDPPGVLRLLCEALGLEYTPRMLSWPTGPRDTDGVWADRWYKAVLDSTGFRPYRPKQERLPDELKQLNDECQSYYRILGAHRLRSKPQ